jgi:glycosyltransferase involved in cell wall biosynthesis
MPPNPGDPGLAEPPFVVFSDDWGEHPSSCQHIFRKMAARHPVLWINTIGMRRPTLTWSDLRKAQLKVSKMLRTSYAREPGETAGLRIHVRQPAMLPFSSSRAIRRINRRLVLSAVHRATEELHIESPVVVSTVPNACDFVGALHARRIVYYCVDDFTQWPGLEHELVRAMERELIARADVLVATSEDLYRRLSGSDKPVHLLTHGVDLDLFSHDAATEHECLAGIPKPRAGYFGLFDERSDQSLIAALAGRMPDFSFVFTGPVATPATALSRHPNVHFTGPLPYAQLPALAKGLDVLFIPYVVNEFTATISPLKLNEYLVTGKPIVSTPIREAHTRSAYLSVAATAEEWERALRAALQSDSAARRRAILPVMESESWASKAQSLLTLCT